MRDLSCPCADGLGDVPDRSSDDCFKKGTLLRIRGFVDRTHCNDHCGDDIALLAESRLSFFVSLKHGEVVIATPNDKLSGVPAENDE